ncbi:CDP-diacylglycerol--glycerol-3-phosphate 3-phosphatidyltransferase [Halopolyspora algeriensis]|uniref:Phosphatidylinositol phosphate synthase n=1 Tax=Halopolyspora algeriensis TaxID=1500506 RepID=A0A368VQI7_9ACTN|nr:CDP-alcohol phosphatidyltransferase family protein [Halopolyspora algeriensis]RCW43920.1 CDP-diacylglycerol--glycerol-3-phosphate 3-phosphatidyltransferase [Halopolyspora algeriensis]TQM53577.1 CDP-diacylglycerol--glycerol-3-phosphate 3-phosphatidyltransferase [Halopolyspora algeriensis]
MLNVFARTAFSRVSDPIGAWLVRRGLSPNAVTVVGTVASVATALWFFPRGCLFVGTVVVTFFLLFDLLDGAMARAGGKASEFGAVLDASCDRIADGVLFGSLMWWALVVADHPVRGLGLLICLVSAQVISYVKARAEAHGLRADGGMAERAQRFVLVLTGVGLHGLGVPYVLDIAVWALVVLSILTIGQRLRAVQLASRTPG